MKEKKENAIVFDLDETLGYFCELGIFIDSLEKILNKKLSKQEFFDLIDMFPEFLRPNILKILKYIKLKKMKRKFKVMIYTNNQRSPQWAKDIKDYFEYKLNYKLFDQVILAFKINGVRVEPNRTSHNKSLRDFVNCTRLEEPINICFIDDQPHPEMVDDNIYYINMFPYFNYLNFNEMIDRYYDKYKNEINIPNFKESMINEMKKYDFKIYEKREEEKELEVVVSKQILNMIDDFFITTIESNKKKTKKINRNIHQPYTRNKTLKLI